MARTIRVAIVDDHPLFREGVVHTVAAQEDMAIIGQGATADDAVRIAREMQPDVIVLDLNLPGDGIAAIDKMAASSPEVNVLMLTVVADEDRVSAAMRHGARGYLLKGVSGPELIATVRAVSQGELYISPQLAARLLSRAAAEPNPFDELTFREQQILRHVAQGLKNQEIAAELQLTEKTVKHYLTGILKKLQVRNRVEAALLVTRWPDESFQRRTGEA
jgi:two-component system, NarL family, nitrate/nitrite response regulator NarL